MKIPVNKILGIGTIVLGGISAIYVERKMYESDKENDSIFAAIARAGVSATIRTAHMQLAKDLYLNENLTITIPSIRTPGEKLLDKTYDIVTKHLEGKITLEEERKRIYKLLIKYQDLSVGERAFLLQLIACDDKLFHSVQEADDTFYYAMIIGDSIGELPTGEEIDTVYTYLSDFLNCADRLYEFLDANDPDNIITKNVEMKFEEIIHRRYSSIDQLKTIVDDINALCTSYLIE